MKNLQKLAGISVCLILIFMIIALFRYQHEDDMTLLPDQFEFLLNEDWLMASFNYNFNHPFESNKQPDDPKQLLEQIKDTYAKGNQRNIVLPYKEPNSTNNTIVFKNSMTEKYAGMTLGFSSNNTIIHVFLDDKIIYQHGPEDPVAQGKSPGNNEHYVNIPNNFTGGELYIALTSPNPDASISLGKVKIESRDMVVIGVVGNSIADIGCCLLIVIMSIIMFVLALIRCYTHQPQRGELFLGLAGLAAGIYCFIGTNTLNIFYDVQEAYEMQEYLVLLVPLFLAIYFERNLHTLYPRRFAILLCCVNINAVVQILLQFANIRKMEDMVNISAAAIGVVCLTAIISLIHYDYKNKRYQTLLSVSSMLVLLTGGIVNVIMNSLFKNAHTNTAGQYSMTLFSIMMAVMHILQLSKEYRANAEEHARILKEKIKTAKQQNAQLALAKKDADAARQEALAANEAKGRFLAHMSHEIRTPINAVLGMDEMILRESKEAQTKEYAMDIYMAGQTLLSLINDILDFSKIESGKMEIVPVEYDTSSLIHDLANMTAQRAKDKNINLELVIDHEIPSRLYGDDVRIRQVLTNILTNAVKYTPEGTVWLRIHSHKTDDNVTLSFEVEDTGIGIKEEDLPKLSAEFERIEEERNRNIEGSGLGMSITIQLLTLLGSKLQVKSTYGKGSKFYFDLEQKIVDATPIGDFESRVQQLAENYNYSTKFCAPRAQVLVVDDNAVNRKVLRNLLKATQIQVTDADSGMKCLELVQEQHYDLIFLDHMMPNMDGIETLHHMKELSNYPCKDTPVVVQTANAVSGAKEKYLSEGFDDFLSKPIVPDKLEVMIKKMLPDTLLEEAPDTEPGTDTHTLQQAGSDMPEDLPQVDGLDWNYAWLHLPDTELLEFTVKEFYAQIESAADRLEDAYKTIRQPDALDQYRIQVHAMKSLAATIGIIPLAGTAKILEYAARDGKTDTLLLMTDIFLGEWRSYRQKLQGVFGIDTKAKTEVTDTSIIQAFIEMVRISMQEMDIDQADQTVKQLLAYKYPSEIEPNIRKLADAVTNLDPDETERLADLLIQQMAT